MKATKNFVASLLTVGLVTMSCNPTNGPNGGDDDSSAKNYIEQNSLVKTQMRGKVKSITRTYSSSTSTNLTEFNEDGNMTIERDVFPQGKSQQSTYTYNSAGALTQYMQTWANNESITTYTYEYNNAGKYIPADFGHFPFVGLTPHLSKITERNDANNSVTTTTFTFSSDKLTIIKADIYQGGGGYNDTTKIDYQGAYPVSHSTGNEQYGSSMKISYQPNGMFDVIKRSSFTTGTHAYKSDFTTTYQKHDTYLLVDKDENIDTNAEYNRTTIYTYNEQSDMLKSDSGENITEYLDYIYDAENNWTSRTYRTKRGAEAWSEATTTTRVIEYY